MPSRDELQWIVDSLEELVKGYDRLAEHAQETARIAAGMGADARMLRLRMQALQADLTPTRAPSASNLAASRSDSRSGLTSAGGFRVARRETQKP